MIPISRRALVQGAGGALLVPGSTRAQQRTKALDDMAAIAAKKPPVIWSESSDPDAIAKVIVAFNKSFPDIKLAYIRDTGGNTLAAKAIQEIQAGGSPASFLTGDPAQFLQLDQRGHLAKPDWAALGVAPALIASPIMVATTAAIGVLIWNKQRVPDAEAPKTMDDMLKPRFAGKLGCWIRGPNFAALSKAMGEAAMRTYLEKMIANGVRVYDSTYRVAQEVGAGELDVGHGLWHSALPILQAGAPLGIAFPNPVSTSTLYSCVVNKGANPEGAQVLATWMTTKEGSDAYEGAVGRGNPFVKGSKASELIAGLQWSEYPVAEMPTFIRLLTEFNRMLSARGAAR